MKPKWCDETGRIDENNGLFQEKCAGSCPYLRMAWIEQVLENPIRIEVQPNGRIRYWGYIAERKKYLRVILEPDGETVHNAFFDRRFKP